jgi:hypothetical protein
MKVVVTVAEMLNADIRRAQIYRTGSKNRTDVPCERLNSCIVHAIVTSHGDKALGSRNQLVMTCDRAPFHANIGTGPLIKRVLVNSDLGIL